MIRHKKIGRMAATVTAPITITAWFFLANHCALGLNAAPGEAAPETTGCPLHSTPAKKKGAAKIPCCKEVRAVVAKCLTARPAAVRAIDPRIQATDLYLQLSRAVIEIAEIDTGPPGCLSFAESVLQESMLSHAPPLS